jgi:hypothetical protein
MTSDGERGAARCSLPWLHRVARSGGGAKASAVCSAAQDGRAVITVLVWCVSERWSWRAALRALCIQGPAETKRD